MSRYELIQPPATAREQRAALRHTVLVASAFLLGAPGAYMAWISPQAGYTAEGTLWIEDASRRSSDVATPMRAAEPQASMPWIELLRSHRVLEPVVVDHKLYLRSPRGRAAAFSSFVLANQFVPGTYRLHVGRTGEDFVLVTGEGDQEALVQEGRFGAPIGENVGFVWTPTRRSFAPGESVEFSVLSVRDAAVDLSARLMTGTDSEGHFLRVRLTGPDRQGTVDVLNSLMERYVAVAAQLKSSKLAETRSVLEEQLHALGLELAEAELSLEEFREATISLPSDRSPPSEAVRHIWTDPVFDAVLDTRVELGQVRADRARLQATLDSLAVGAVRIEALEVIPAAATSSELRGLLGALVEARSELRALRDRYADDYPPIQDLVVRIETIERGAIPEVVRGIIRELTEREAEMLRYVDAISVGLAEMPPRTIEEARLRRRVVTTENLYREVRTRVETARSTAASSTPDVRILDRATTVR